MNSEKVEGFVLLKKQLLEKDYLVTVFTKEKGKVTAIAKGIRKLTSRRAAHLQTGNLVKLQLRQFNDTWYIQSSDLVSGFMLTRTEKKMEVMYLYLFILNRLLPVEEPENYIYSLTTSLFIKLSKQENEYKKLLEDTLFKTLRYLGYIESRKPLNDLITEVENQINEKLPDHDII